MRLIASLLVLTAMLAPLVPGMASGEEVCLTVDLPPAAAYEIAQSPLGLTIGFEGCGYRMKPGSPMLPTKTLLVALPPGAVAGSLEARFAGANELQGTFTLAVQPEPRPIGAGSRSVGPHGRRSSAGLVTGGTGDRAESRPAAGSYPAKTAWISGSGSLGRYGYVAVTLCPCTYDERSGKIMRYDTAEIRLTCEPEPRPGLEAGKPAPGADCPAIAARARKLFANFSEIEDLYPSGEDRAPSPLQAYDYVIVTTGSLSAAVTSSNFVTWKTSLGYSVRIVLVSDPEISGQPGGDLAEQIRNFLRAYYTVWGIEYVLMVGDYATVPMRYCYPDPTNHTNTAGTPGGTGGEVPTDCYYADLSATDALSWDSDGDGYYGEYGEDSPDFMPEVYVGRVPIINTARITYALNKIVAFEQDTGAWKHNALHAGAFWYFTHEISDTTPCMDAAHYLSYIEADIMSGWTVTRYSEQSGLEVSAYSWPALTEAAFATSWRTGQHAIVNWGAHGWTNSIARKVWDWDDGDGIPEASEISWPTMLSTSSNLDDDYPSIVTSASCLVGCPEPNSYGNMGIKMLVLPDWGPAVAVIASARSPYGTPYWPPGGSESIIYEFNDLMITDLEKVGRAFYDSKFYCTTNYGWDNYAEYINMYTFNLWGDPSLTREGIDLAGIMPGGGSEEAGAALRLAAGPSPARGDVTITYYLPSTGRPRLEVFDVLGRRVRSIALDAQGSGRHTTTWGGLNDAGAVARGGVYWIRLSVGEHSEAVKVLRMK